MTKSRIIIAVLIAAIAGLLVFLTVWDPPAPTEEVRKDVTDDLLAR